MLKLIEIGHTQVFGSFFLVFGTHLIGGYRSVLDLKKVSLGSVLSSRSGGLPRFLSLQVQQILKIDCFSYETH